MLIISVLKSLSLHIKSSSSSTNLPKAINSAIWQLTSISSKQPYSSAVKMTAALPPDVDSIDQSEDKSTEKNITTIINHIDATTSDHISNDGGILNTAVPTIKTNSDTIELITNKSNGKHSAPKAIAKPSKKRKDKSDFKSKHTFWGPREPKEVKLNSDGVEETNTEAQMERKPKKKVALLMSYCGTGYSGMQL